MRNVKLPPDLKITLGEEAIVFYREGREVKAYRNYKKSAITFGVIWFGGLFLMLFAPLLGGDAFVLLFALLFSMIGIAWIVQVKKKLNQLRTEKVIYVGTTERLLKYKNGTTTAYEWSQFANIINVAGTDSDPARNDLTLYLKSKPGGGDFRYKRAVTNGSYYVLQSFLIEGVKDGYGVERKCFASINQSDRPVHEDFDNDHKLSLSTLRGNVPENTLDFLSKETVVFVVEERRRTENGKRTIGVAIAILSLPTLFTLGILTDVENFLQASIPVILLTVGTLSVFFWAGVKLLRSIRPEKEGLKSYFIGSLDRLIHCTDNNLRTIGWNEFAAVPRVQSTAGEEKDLVFDLKGGYKRKSSFLQKKIVMTACPEMEEIAKESAGLIKKHRNKENKNA